jgi:23S rRNA (uracil1939-C5)-methyltransferase
MKWILLVGVGAAAVTGFQQLPAVSFISNSKKVRSSTGTAGATAGGTRPAASSLTTDEEQDNHTKDRYVAPGNTPNGKKKKKNTGSNNKVKPRQKAKQQSSSSFQGPRLPPPLLVDYEQQHFNHRREAEQQETRVHSDTIAATCPHFASCAGCTVAKAADTPVIAAAQRYFAKERYQGGPASSSSSNSGSTTKKNDHDSSDFLLVVPTALTGWRTQAKLVAANKSSSNKWMKNGGCVFGLYQQGSHDVLPIPQCVVHHPSINQAIALLEAATAAANIGAYDETTREGDLRYVQLQTERTTGKVCLTLVWNASSQKETQPGLSRLVKQLEQQMTTVWHSIWCHCNDGFGNTIFTRKPDRWTRLAGPEFLREPIPVAAAASLDDDYNDTKSAVAAAAGWFYFTPLTFRQGNMDGFDILANDVARSIPGGSKVCELYGGVGVLGLTTLAYHQQRGYPLQWLRCSDENPANARCFHRSTESLFGGGLITSRSSRQSGRRSPPQSSDNDGEITFAELMKLGNLNDAFQGSKKNKYNAGEGTVTATNQVSYVVASAAQALLSGQALGANVLIVDPPRKGLEEEVLLELIKPRNRDQPYGEDATMDAGSEERINWANDINLLIYVSCGFDALARDCDRLLSSRAGWSIKSSTGYLLFPGSDHVETLAIFQRR